MGHTYQNWRTWKYESNCAKWVTFGQMGQTWEGESHSQMGIKWVTLIKIGTWRYSHTAQNGSIWPNGSNLGSHTL